MGKGTRCAKHFFFLNGAVQLSISHSFDTDYVLNTFGVCAGGRTSRRRIGAGGFRVEEAVVSGRGTEGS